MVLLRCVIGSMNLIDLKSVFRAHCKAEIYDLNISAANKNLVFKKNA